jgi:hypothetical protein
MNIFGPFVGATVAKPFLGLLAQLRRRTSLCSSLLTVFVGVYLSAVLQAVGSLAIPLCI